MRAPSSPPQLAAVGGVFARLQHRSVVVPELLNALSTQVRVCVCVCWDVVWEWECKSTGGASCYMFVRLREA